MTVGRPEPHCRYGKHTDSRLQPVVFELGHTGTVHFNNCKLRVDSGGPDTENGLPEGLP